MSPVRLHVEIFEKLRPLLDQFSASQFQMLLMAWLPLHVGGVLSTGVYVVDMFIMSALATLVMSSLQIVQTIALAIAAAFSGRKSGDISFRIEPTRTNQYGQKVTNPYHSAFSWLITRGVRGQDTGSFVVQTCGDYYSSDTPLRFDILPDASTNCSITYNDVTYDITMSNAPEANKNGKDNDSDDEGDFSALSAITIQPSDKSSLHDVAWAEGMLQEIYTSYHKDITDAKKRTRWELSQQGHWFCSVDLQASRGLVSVALDKDQEEDLAQDLKTFLDDREFYAQIGLPYRRGYMFHGRPGTGKTSLVNAIAGELERDLYFLNLRNITSDSTLQSVISQVPKDQIIVFEDIDAMSRVTHKRSKRPSFMDIMDMESMEGGGPVEGPKSPKAGGFFGSGGPFSLSALLNCLDGHSMEPGIIVIMTTNHPEVLDPALVRPGRIDLTLDLGCTSRYQVTRMFENIVHSIANNVSSGSTTIPEGVLDAFPEGLIPPCEMMRLMLLHRRNPDRIWPALNELIAKFKDGALSIEEEEQHLRDMEREMQEAAEAAEQAKKEREERGEAEEEEVAKKETEKETEKVAEKVAEKEAEKETKETEKEAKEHTDDEVEVNGSDAEI